MNAQRILSILLLSVGTVQGALAQNRPGLSLRETFDLYVRSIQKSDLNGLFSTVTDSSKFFFLTSAGKLIDTREGYYKFHQDWFKEPGWEMPVDCVEVHQGRDCGYTTAIFHYRSKMREGGTYILDSWFTLIFRQEDGMWKVVADVCTPIKRGSVERSSDTVYDSDQLHFFEVIRNRRTVRKFKSTPVPKEHILKILDAARFAPTAGNQQPWKFLVVQDRAKLDRLRGEALRWYVSAYEEKAKPDEQKLATIRASVEGALLNALSAPAYVAVLVDTMARYPNSIREEGALAAENLMLAARALGYGTGYYTTFFPEEKMRLFFRIPDHFKLLCFTPIGVPDGWPPPPSKKELSEIVVFEEF